MNKQELEKIKEKALEEHIPIIMDDTLEVIEKELTVVDKLELKEIKTKSMVKALTALKVEGKTLIIVPEKNTNVVMSARNIEGVRTVPVNAINVYDIMKYETVILTKSAVAKIEEVYA